MRIVVTGAAGKAGTEVVKDLLEHRHQVVACDTRRSEQSATGIIMSDLTTPGEVFELLAGSDAVIHLAAIPAPGISTPVKTFHNNILSTFNILEAAKVLDIKRVVMASSETVLGLPFQNVKPRYAPIDEEHPLFPESTYALSKRLGEEMAKDYHRWTGCSIVNLRFSNIMRPEDYARFPRFQDDPHQRKWNLWGYVDVRDVAQACRKAALAEGLTAESFIIAAADTVMRRPSRELVSEVFPDTEIKPSLQDRQTCLGIEKARRLLGYAPEHSWQSYV